MGWHWNSATHSNRSMENTDMAISKKLEIADYYVDACDFCRDIFNDNYKTSILEKFYRTEKNVMN